MHARLFSLQPKGLLAVVAALFLAACGGGGEPPQTEGPAIAGMGGGTPLAQRLNRELMGYLPEKPGKNWIFDGYVNHRAGDVAWSRSWTRKVDYTGVAWDHTRTLTLVTPRHVVMAKHYTRKPGELVRFNDRSGKEVQRVLMGVKKLDVGEDIAVGVLSEPVPPSIRHYKLLEPADDLRQNLPGTLALVTDGERLVHVHEVSICRLDFVRFRFPSALPKGFSEALTKGDSGNPSFVIVRGEPVLLETHTVGGAGAGPFYGSAAVQAAITAAIADLAVQNGGGEYAISTVRP